MVGLHRMELKEVLVFFFFQAEDGIRDYKVTGVQTCALPICRSTSAKASRGRRARSPMSRPQKVTESDSGFSRLPWQTGQRVPTMNLDTLRFIIALWLVANVCIT